MGQVLRDENGTVTGYYFSPAEYERLMYKLAHAEFDRRDAEAAAKGVERPKWDGKNGMTTDDVRALFRRLDAEQEGRA